MEVKNYRPNVAAVILSSKYPFECKVFLARRTDVEDAWQFPQGGIDKGETPKIALFRELKEEIGTNKVEIIDEYPEWISYDYPSEVIAQKNPKFDGQIQRYFLVRLVDEKGINLDTKEPEFNAYKFVSIDEAISSITHFKKDVYAKVLEYFKKKGYI